MDERERAKWRAQPCGPENEICLYGERIDAVPWEYSYNCLIHGTDRHPTPYEKVSPGHPHGGYTRAEDPESMEYRGYHQA